MLASGEWWSLIGYFNKLAVLKNNKIFFNIFLIILNIYKIREWLDSQNVGNQRQTLSMTLGASSFCQLGISPTHTVTISLGRWRDISFFLSFFLSLSFSLSLSLSLYLSIYLSLSFFPSFLLLLFFTFSLSLCPKWWLDLREDLEMMGVTVVLLHCCCLAVLARLGLLRCVFECFTTCQMNDAWHERWMTNNGTMEQHMIGTNAGKQLS